MKFLLDQDIFAITRKFLEELGHNVISAADLGLAQAADTELLNVAQEQQRIFVTRDRDFGSLVFVKNMGSGVIYLRILPSSLHEGHKELETVLGLYSEDELEKAFVVVEPGRHRFRKLPH